MPRYGEVRPLNIFADFMAGKQARQDEQVQQQQNALRDLQLQRAQNVNALAQNPDATPEDYIRGGDAQTGAALANYQGQKQDDKRQALAQLASVAQKALTIQDYAQRKQFLSQATRAYGPAFSALGADLTKAPEMLAMPDDALEQMLQQVAQFAPQKDELKTTEGPFGSKIVQQGGRFQVVEPPKSASSEVNSQLITRPTGEGTVQDFMLNPRTGQRTPSGQPYKPVSTSTGNPTEGERASANYVGRMEAAERLLGEYTPGTKDYAAALQIYGKENAGMLSTSIANKVMSEQGQKYYQAAADWVRAKLRKESGAVISPSEMAQEIRTYFPVPGDTAATIAQKKASRAQAQEGMRNMAGRATPHVLGAAPQASQPMGGPAVGTVDGGYRFKGGDPANKNSWEPVR